jgi:hypothetical protein
MKNKEKASIEAIAELKKAEEKLKKEQDRLEKLVEEEKTKNEVIAKFDKASRYIDDFTKENLKFLAGCLVVFDSNIWMNQDYDSFFKSLSHIYTKNKFQISLYGAQFDEIVNIKKSSDYQDEKKR